MQFITLFNFFFAFSFSNKYQFLPSKSKNLSKNKLGFENTLFMRLISLLLKRELIISSIRYFISCLYEFELLNEVCTSDYPFLFIISPGGYSGHYRTDSRAFLFSLVNKPGWAPVKLPQTMGRYSSYGHSIYECSSCGPTFGGGHDIYIANYASSNSNSAAYLGYAYSPPSGYNYGGTFTYTFLAGGSSYNFTPDEVETFYETT